MSKLLAPNTKPQHLLEEILKLELIEKKNTAVYIQIKLFFFLTFHEFQPHPAGFRVLRLCLLDITCVVVPEPCCATQHRLPHSLFDVFFGLLSTCQYTYGLLGGCVL